MQISRTLFNQMCTLWANNPIVFIKAAGSEPAVHAVISDFSYDPNLQVADLDLATEDLDPVTMLTLDEAIGEWVDPVTDEYVVSLKSNAASGDWLQLVETLGAPFQIWGYAMTTGDGVSLLGIVKSPAPIEVNANGQGVVCRDVEFRIPTNIVR